MTARFRNRTEAGELLAEKLHRFRGAADAIILALPRGGVPVGAAVADALELPLDVLVIRKLGLPGYPETAMGAIGPDGVEVIDEDVLRRFNVSASDLDEIRASERRELARREELYRAGRPPLELKGKTAIIVDDGIATGATASAALVVVRRLGAKVVVVAAPVMSTSAFFHIHGCADYAVAVSVDERFTSVGACYDDFEAVRDEEVLELLRLGQDLRSG